MSIPYYQFLKLPLLKSVEYSEEHSLRAVADVLAEKSKLTAEERKQSQQSGNQTVFINRVVCARIYIYKVGLLEPKRRFFPN